MALRQNQKQFTPQVDRIYLKPLTQGAEINTSEVLKKFKADLLRRVRKALTQETFSAAAKRTLSKALQIKVGPSSLTIVAKHPAWKPLVEGQKKGPMTWLAKARAPIPIVTETGKVIFRVATARSLANGKWVHPGRQKSHFYDRAREASRDFLKKKLASEFQRQLSRASR